MASDSQSTGRWLPSAWRSPKDYAIEFGEYLAKAAEGFMAEQNRAMQAGELPDSEYWMSLRSAIYEFRKRAARAEGKST